MASDRNDDAELLKQVTACVILPMESEHQLKTMSETRICGSLEMIRIVGHFNCSWSR